MITELEADLFSNPDNFTKLNHLFVFFEKGKHEMFLSVDVSESDWIDNKSKKDFCETVFKNSAYINPKNIDLKIKSEEDVENRVYSLKDGYIYLENNLIIFVENGTSDRYFLHSLFLNFKPESEKIIEAIKNRWLEYDSAGGKNEIIKRLESELRKFRTETLKNEKYLRAVVIIDSDKKFKGEKLGGPQQKILDYCAEKNIKCHILEKREIENYLPLEALEDLPNNPNIIEAYSQLNSEQQSYYDLEKGFNGPLKNTAQEVQDLFDDIPVANMTALRNGFRSIIDKNDIPPLFRHKNVTRDTLISKCNSNELLDIIEAINNLL